MLQRMLRGWASSASGEYKTKKGQLQTIITDLDTSAEDRILTEAERNQLEQARCQLSSLLRDEEIRFYQRAKVKMYYWETIIPDISIWWQTTNIEKRIFSLDHEDGIIEGQNNLKTYITQFYKELFAELENSHFSLDEKWI
jgi:hypothetical protein